MQDSIVQNNFLAYVKEDLDNVKDMKILKEYKKDPKKRNMFLLNSILRNSGRIKEDLEDRFQFAAMFVEQIIKLIEKQSK
jgi:hypothetical protein